MNEEIQRLFSLRGRVALIVGASRGIGAELARGLAAAGAVCIGVGRSKRPELADAEFEYRSCDMADPAQVAELLKSIGEAHGRLDILVNAAAISLAAGEGLDAREVFGRTVATNLTAVHGVCLEAAQLMERSGGGSIINVTSIGSVLGFPNNPGYVASKGGLRMLSRALAIDFAPRGIRVNNLAPGYVRTAMTEASFLDPERHAARVERMIMKRWGTPVDLVGAAIFLASDASAYVTGSDIFVDGGWTAKGL